jgi:Ca2+/H+ antiporter
MSPGAAAVEAGVTRSPSQATTSRGLGLNLVVLLSDDVVVAGSRVVCFSLAVLLLAVGLAACGGGKKTYIYNFAGKDTSSAGIYLTIISPVKLPPSAFKNGKLVDHVSGPEDCAFTQKINKPPRKYASLLGAKLTIKVYGAAATAKFICSIIRRSGSTQIIHP